MEQMTLVNIAYILLIVSGAFLDMPMLAIIALPIFILSIIFFLASIFRLPVHQEANRWLASILLLLGTFLLAATVFQTAIETTQYLVAVSRDNIERFFPNPSLTASKLIGLSLLSSLFLALGIKERTKWPLKIIVSIGFTLFLAAPLTAMAVKILEVMGIPLTA